MPIYTVLLRAEGTFWISVTCRDAAQAELDAIGAVLSITKSKSGYSPVHWIVEKTIEERSGAI